MTSDHLDPITEPTFVRRVPPPRRRGAPFLWLTLALLVGVGAFALARRYADQLPLDPSRSVAPLSHERAASVPADSREPVDRPIPFSVALEAHQDLGLALEREATLRTAVSGVAFYLSPVRLDETLYYRVLAGPSADSASAARLMARLVAEGQRTEAESWAIRPTEWAYDLGEFDVRQVAEARRAELIRQAIPTYIVEIPYSWGPPRYRLYAGAYEGRGDADALGEILREAGYSPPLRTRMGQPIQ